MEPDVNALRCFSDIAKWCKMHRWIIIPRPWHQAVQFSVAAPGCGHAHQSFSSRHLTQDDPRWPKMTQDTLVQTGGTGVVSESQVKFDGRSSTVNWNILARSLESHENFIGQLFPNILKSLISEVWKVTNISYVRLGQVLKISDHQQYHRLKTSFPQYSPIFPNIQESAWGVAHLGSGSRFVPSAGAAVTISNPLFWPKSQCRVSLSLYI